MDAHTFNKVSGNDFRVVAVQYALLAVGKGMCVVLCHVSKLGREYRNTPHSATRVYHTTLEKRAQNPTCGNC